MKKALKVIGIVLAVVVLIAAGYVVSVFAAFHRIGNQELPVGGAASAGAAEIGTEYRIVSYNIGFGAYEADYGFFMDGGTQSWAWSKERLDANLKDIAALLRGQDADFTTGGRHRLYPQLPLRRADLSDPCAGGERRVDFCAKL